MGLSEQDARACAQRLLLSRLRLLATNGFFGLLLMHARFGLDMDCETAYTDGRVIRFSPDFLKELSDGELDFVLMHEVMHMALRHCLRGRHLEQMRFNIACDIVVNSNILLSADMDEDSITLSKYGISMHTAPDGKEGFHYTAEQVYEMLPSMPDKPKRSGRNSASGFWDNHEKWQELPDDEYESEQWDHLLQTACEVISIREASQTYGGGPLMAQRLMRLGRKSEIDWRTVLQEFLQEEINDYSFSPPDRRFADSDFFLPDYNEKEEVPGKVWFLIDTSGSISDQAINAAYGEICSAIEQFGGKLEGLLSFTESYVTEPISFHSITELMDIKPIGGGGNDFSDIFRYMRNHMAEDLPGYIVIITDGYDRFPPESDAMGVPVLWLINNENATPPWGKVARIKV
jgi:predicted metal-dependent peptidase